jgi:hypothetical protein
MFWDNGEDAIDCDIPEDDDDDDDNDDAGHDSLQQPLD